MPPPKDPIKYAEFLKHNSESHKGLKMPPRTDEWRRKQSESHKGQKISEEQRQKLSAALKGRPSPMKGKHHSEKTKKQIGESCKRVLSAPEKRSKISAGLKGHPVLESTRKKISAAQSGANGNNFGKKVSPEVQKKKEQSMRLFYEDEDRSKAARKKISETHKGSKHHCWKGGITPLNNAIRSSLEYRSWVLAVFERDCFTCQDCKKKGGKIEAHHIKSFSRIIRENHITTLEQALECEELWDVSNGKTVCKKCHMTNYSTRERVAR